MDSLCFAGKPLLTMQEAAVCLGVDTESVEDLVHSGVLSVFGKGKLLRTAELLEFADPHGRLTALKKPPLEKGRLLVEILDEMLEIKKDGLAGATIDGYTTAAKHIRDAFANTPLESLRQKDLELFYQSLQNRKTGKRLSNLSVLTIRKVLHMVLHYASVNGYLSDPAALYAAKVKSGYKVPKDARFLSSDMVARLLDVLKDNPQYYTLVRLLLATGMRIGEALALKYRDFDRKRGVVTVSQAIKKGDVKDGCSAARQVIVGEPKSESAVREIPIPTEIFDMIENWKHYNYARQREKLPRKMAQYVFVNAQGNLITYRTLSVNFQKYLKRHPACDLPKVTFHMLRHTYGSLMLEQGTTLEVVSKLLGHKKISITADIYITITKKLHIEAAKACSNMLKEIDSMGN